MGWKDQTCYVEMNTTLAMCIVIHANPRCVKYTLGFVVAGYIGEECYIVTTSTIEKDIYPRIRIARSIDVTSTTLLA